MAPSYQPPQNSCLSCSVKGISCANDAKREPDKKQPNFKRKTDIMQNDNKSESCSCEDCTEPKTCLYYDKRKNERPINLHLVNTLPQQESAGAKQKNAYLIQSKGSKGSKSPAKLTGSQTSGMYGLMVETLSQQESAVEEQKSAYFTQSKASKGSFTEGSKTSKSPTKRTGSQPSGVYGLMAETLSRQESAVEEQKNAYFIQSKGSKDSCTECSKTSKSPTRPIGSQPSDIVFDLMVETLSQQESEVDEQKCAYLLQNKESEGSCCFAGSKTKGSDKQLKSPANRTRSLPSGVYGVIIKILSQQEAAVEGEKSVYLIQNKGSKGSCTACSKTRGSDKKSKPLAKCQGPKSSGVYGVLIDILSQQDFAGEGQKNAYLPQSKDCKQCKRTAVKDKKSAYPPPDNCSGIVVTKLTPKLARSDKLNAPPSSSLARATELLKYVAEHKSTYSIQSKCSNCKSNNISLDRRTTTSSGSCKGSNEGPCFCPSRSKSELNNKQLYNVNKITTETNPMSYKNCSECSQLAKKKYDSPKYSAEVKRYEPTNNAQELFRNIFQTQTYKYQNEMDECDTYTKNIVSESPGYVFELPKNTYNLTQQNDCPSNKSSTSVSKLSGYVPELQKYRTTPNRPESAMNTEFNINRCQVKWNTTDPNKMILKASCHDDDLDTKRKFESCGYVVEVPKVQEKVKCDCDSKLKASPGYVVDLPKVKGKKKCNCGDNLHKSSGSVVELPKVKGKKKCDCDDKLHESSGYVVDLPKVKGKKKCDCDDKLRESSGYVVDLPKVKGKKKCDCDDKLRESSGYVVDLPKVKGKKTCDCDDKLRESSGYVVDLPKVKGKKKCDCDDKLRESSGYVIDLPKVKEKKKCNCNKCQVKWITSDTNNLVLKAQCDDLKKKKKCESSGYVMELPQVQKKTKHDYDDKLFESCGYVVELPKVKEYKKCTKCISTEFLARPLPKSENPPSQNAQDSSSCRCGPQLKSSEYPESESEQYARKMKFMEVPGYVFEIPKPTPSSCNCNNLSKYSIQSDIQNICKSMVGSIMETGPKSLIPTHAPNIYGKLCNKILKIQSETIETLKHSYSPEKSDVQTDTCSACNPTDERIEKRSAKEFSCSIESDSSYTISKCDLLKRIKDVYKACSCRTCECKPSKIDAHESQKLCECDESLSPILSYEMNQWEICGGKPHDCVQCFKTMNVHHCQTLMVAPVGREENVSRLEGTPCFEGGTVYPLDSHVVNEMSTSMNRHALCRCEVCLNENCDRNGVDACTCHKHNKIMSKPVGPDTYDFDIRTTKVVYDKPMFRQVGQKLCNGCV